MPEPTGTTKAELQAKIESAWDTLRRYLDGLSVDQMTGLLDAEGWSVRDHLVHLARWEASVTVLFHGQPRHLGLGIEPSEYASADFDEINAVIHERTKDLTLGAVMAELRKNHDDLMAALLRLSDADLKRTVSESFPQAPAGDDRQVLDVILDNTAQHFAEHLGWIETLVRRPA